MNNLTELDKRIKDLFFQLITTGNKYVSYAIPNLVEYKLIDGTMSGPDKEVCWHLNYYHHQVDITNEIKGMHDYNTLVFYDKNPSKWVFTLTRGRDVYKVNGLTLHEYADACTILDNVIKEFQMKQLDQLDRLTDELENNEL